MTGKNQAYPNHHSPETTSICDRVRGVLLGLAAGDRNGGPVRMALQLGESLAELQNYDENDVLRRYLLWWRTDGVDSGPTAAHVFHLVHSGVPLAKAVALAHAASGGKSAGCNPAHRCAPLAMAGFLREELLAASAQSDAALTHQDPLAGDVAAAVVVLCRALICGQSWSDAIVTACTGRMPATTRSLQNADTLPRSSGGYAPDVLHAAAHFAGDPRGFAQALGAALEFAGPANFCPVLAGAIAGARWGAIQIPPDQLKHCSDLMPRILAVEDRLAGAWPS